MSRQENCAKLSDDVHAGHCCTRHGCKYDDPDCPVVSGKIPQKYPCDECIEERRAGSLSVVGSPVEGEREIREEEEIRLGQWYWVSDCDCPYTNCECDKTAWTTKWLGCVLKVGTNFAEIHEVRGPREGSSCTRIHFNEFHDRCRREFDPERVISENIERHREAAKVLMLEVKEVTARIGVAPRAGIEQGGQEPGTALMTMSEAPDVDEYKSALIKAKEEELPELFKQIKEENANMARWMSAELMPMTAELSQMQGLVKHVEDRIFHVELYAGLTEQVVRVANGSPAEISEKLRVMQRRHYMDEECLANYQTGGMKFDDLEKFDKWICRSENLERLLPFPRCIVAFRVRRHKREQDPDENAFVKLWYESKEVMTYLYIRNGEQVFRMSTTLDFGPKIVPDPRQFGTQKLYADLTSYDKVNGFITEGEYLEREKNTQLHRKWIEEHPDKCGLHSPYHRKDRLGNGHNYAPFDPSSVFYDDMQTKIQDEIKQYNRIALILQGLYDRSPVLHPHPPVRLWENKGFQQAVEVILDDDRALTAGEKPDFEAFRKKCNRFLKKGSVTVGQQVAWERREAEKECEKRDRDWRHDRSSRPTRFRPYGNPGPGYLAIVHKRMPRAKKCTYEWNRERQRDGYDSRGEQLREGDPIRTTFTAEDGDLLCVDGYEPGDYRQFFNDPRTRAEYLRWAPFLLTAEEYYAGNLTPEGKPQAGFMKSESQTLECKMAELKFALAALEKLGWKDDKLSHVKKVINRWKIKRPDKPSWASTDYYNHFWRHNHGKDWEEEDLQALVDDCLEEEKFRKQKAAEFTKSQKQGEK